MTKDSRTLLVYGGALLSAAAAIAILLSFIPNFISNVSYQSAPLAAFSDKNHILMHLLCALSFILIITRIFGSLAKLIGEPAVIGEVLGGILIGPSLLGLFFPSLSAAIFPPQIIPHISMIAQLGIIFYMFVVGLEFDLNSLKNNAHSTLLISHVSIVFPLFLGIALGILTYSELAPIGVNPMHFALFFGISLSITAFPVLARILTDKKIDQSRIGKISLACAAIDDVTAWCLLALCLSLLQAKLSSGILTLLGALAYILFALFVAKPLLSKWITRIELKNELNTNTLAFFFVALFLSALTTEFIGIHAIFGAFLLGVIVPHNCRTKEELTRYTENLSKIVFLPAFFVFTGLRTQIALLSTPYDWILCALIVFVATLGKLGGATLAAKYSGFKTREAFAIGALMNTRGLVELVVLNIGLDMNIISPRLFTMLVIMALITTFMTSPLVSWLLQLNGHKKLA